MSGNLDPSSWRLQTPGGIKYRRYKHKGKVTWESVQATEVYIIRCSDLQAFIRELFPAPQIVNGIPIYTYTPMQGSMRISATSIEWDEFDGQLAIDPFGADSNAPAGTYADICKVTVSYDDSADKPGNNTNPGEIDQTDPTTFLQISANATGEFLHVPTPSNYSWVNADGQTEQNAALNAPTDLIVPEIEWNLSWPRVNHYFFENTFIDRLRSILGKTNSESYDLLYGALPDTLMFVGWSMVEERQFLFNDEINNVELVRNPLRIDMKIIEKKVPYVDANGEDQIAGHQHFWRPGVGWQRLVKSLAPTDYIYERYNFNDLFATE